MRILIALVLMLAAFGSAAADTFQDALRPPSSTTSPTHPSLYSFADVYRFTVSGAATGGPLVMPTTDAAIRVAATQPAGTPELQFSVVSIPEPERWLLLLSGLLLATWVARRRLGYFF